MLIYYNITFSRLILNKLCYMKTHFFNMLSYFLYCAKHLLGIIILVKLWCEYMKQEN